MKVTLSRAVVNPYAVDCMVVEVKDTKYEDYRKDPSLPENCYRGKCSHEHVDIWCPKQISIAVVETDFSNMRLLNFTYDDWLEPGTRTRWTKGSGSCNETIDCRQVTVHGQCSGNTYRRLICPWRCYHCPDVPEIPILTIEETIPAPPVTDAPFNNTLMENLTTSAAETVRIPFKKLTGEAHITAIVCIGSVLLGCTLAGGLMWICLSRERKRDELAKSVSVERSSAVTTVLTPRDQACFAAFDIGNSSQNDDSVSCETVNDPQGDRISGKGAGDVETGAVIADDEQDRPVPDPKMSPNGSSGENSYASLFVITDGLITQRRCESANSGSAEQPSTMESAFSPYEEACFAGSGIENGAKIANDVHRDAFDDARNCCAFREERPQSEPEPDNEANVADDDQDRPVPDPKMSPSGSSDENFYACLSVITDGLITQRHCESANSGSEKQPSTAMRPGEDCFENGPQITDEIQQETFGGSQGYCALGEKRSLSEPETAEDIDNKADVIDDDQDRPVPERKLSSSGSSGESPYACFSIIPDGIQTPPS
ncbi:uncharacterized protein LOC106177149 [Lingula anatina]|uniref:Uncharacterized protein LOC106177149 n=1 Tax=Lingula anatina TaxID=7574 RepID=A0A1S3JZ33_LINAN|nr:uncharacterized protein LOC106177149 [Lingula anatina]|eukprot:XP_013415291.1 uncharacterized protein LOC106177149 [Lingula anatina]